ncbi:MAG TPA: HAD family phosphatase [Polyangiaceae bacterium]
MKQHRAVIFDLGGVILDSPFSAIRAWQSKHGLPATFFGSVVLGGGDAGAWARLERGELGMPEFCSAFDAELQSAGGPTGTAEIMAEMARTTLLRPIMIEAVRRLRTAGLQTAALTNNWVSDDGQYARMAELQLEFDVFIESCKVGLRKPDPRIYELTCRELGVSPAEAVFLDDIGENLKAARKLGITTIKVTEPAASLAELERVLGVELVEPTPSIDSARS